MPNKTKSTCDREHKPLTLEEAIEHCEECVDDTPCGKGHKQLAEWLKELDRLRTTPGGNIYALRMALVKAHTMLKICDWPDGTDMNGVADVMKEIESAIEAPARNCDEGTPEEQYHAWLHFCEEHLLNCHSCPYGCQTPVECSFRWAQMPYSETKGAEK